MSYLSEVLADNPLHYWRLADPGGTFAVNIGSGGFHLDAGGANEKLGFAGPNSDGGSFNTNGGFGVFGLGGNAGGSPFTMELWTWPIYFRGTTSVLFAWNETSAPFIGIDQIANLSFRVNGPPVAMTIPFTFNQRWSHVACTYDQVNWRTYLNGVPIGVQADTRVLTWSLPIGIGEAPNFTSPSSHFVSEVAWYPRALSAARILAHFNAADQRFQLPFYRLPSTYTSAALQAAPGSDPSGSNLTDILNAVRKVFPTT